MLVDVEYNFEYSFYFVESQLVNIDSIRSRGINFSDFTSNPLRLSNSSNN